MSGGTFEERDPCMERGSFDLGSGKPPRQAVPDTGDAGHRSQPGAGVRVFPDWWPARFRTFMGASTARLVERIGAGDVRAVILSGSFAAGEGSVLFEESGPLFLSDIDLVVVLETLTAHARWYERRGELGEACEALFPEATFSGRFDVGTFLPGDLPSLPPRPGVFDLASHGVVLWGDADVLSLVPSYGEDRIDGVEALVLLENRMISLLGAYPDGDDSERDFTAPFRYEIARVYTDIATAVLCAAHAYRPGYGARVRVLSEYARAGRIDGLIPPQLVPLVERWTDFKLDPGSGSPERERRGGVPLGLWEEAARHLLDTWRRCGAHRQGLPTDDTNLPPAASLIRRRGHAHGRLDVLRSWRRWLARLPIADRMRTVAALRGALLRLAPLDAIRNDGVRLIERRVRGGAACGVPPLTIASGDRRERWESAAGRVHRMWAKIVFG